MSLKTVSRIERFIVAQIVRLADGKVIDILSSFNLFRMSFEKQNTDRYANGQRICSRGKHIIFSVILAVTVMVVAEPDLSRLRRLHAELQQLTEGYHE